MTLNTSKSRVINWIREMLFFLICCFVCSIVGLILTLLISNLLGIEDTSNLANSLNENSTFGDRNAIRLILFLNQLSLFILPSIAYGVWKYRREALSRLKLSKLPELSNVIHAILIILSAYPVVMLMMWLNQQIPITEAMLALEEKAAETTKYLLTMSSITEFLITLFIVGITPAIGEELMFRGVLQPMFEKLFKNGHVAVWITAFLFSAIHLQMQGFLPRMFLGGILGYFFLYTRNLWLPMIAHFIFNGSQVIAQYSGKIEIENPEVKLSEIIIPSLVFAVILSYLIFQFIQKNKPINKAEIM